MSGISTQFRGGLTRLQVGTAACAVAAAAAFPAVVANAEVAMPSAPAFTQMIDVPSAPNFAQLPPDITEWVEEGRAKIETFRPLVFVTRVVAGVVLAPFVIAEVVPQVINALSAEVTERVLRLLRLGPYGNSSN